MAKMPAEVRTVVEKVTPYPIATASPEGKPNLVYVSFLRVLDDETLQIADNFFNKTRANLDANPLLTVTCLDPESKKCYQIKGSCQVFTSGPEYCQCVEWVRGVRGTMTPKAAVNMTIEEMYAGAERLA